MTIKNPSKSFKGEGGALRPKNPDESQKAEVANAQENMSTPNPPTPYQLAKIAAILATRQSESAGEQPTNLVSRALRLWQAAVKVSAEVSEIEEQKKRILDGVLTLEVDEWNELLRSYKGSETELTRLIGSKMVPVREVIKALYPAKKETTESRAEKTAALLRRHPSFNKCQGAQQSFELAERELDHAIERITILPTIEQLKANDTSSSINGHICRFLIEEREAEKSGNMRRK